MPRMQCERGHVWDFAGETGCPQCGSSRLTEMPESEGTVVYSLGPQPAKSLPANDQTLDQDGLSPTRPANDQTLDQDSLPPAKIEVSKRPLPTHDQTLDQDSLSPSRPANDQTIDQDSLNARPTSDATIDLPGDGSAKSESEMTSALDSPSQLLRTQREGIGSATVGLETTSDKVKVQSLPGYEILDQLGKGGMGVVYKAKQIKLGRLVAVKMILGGGLAGKEQIARFRFEAESIAALQHPNIVQVYEVGEADGCPFFSLEYVEGKSLDDLIDGPQPPAEAVRLIETLCRAMHAAHLRGIIHRDLKPANVLLAKDGTPKITDFGLAKRMDQADEGKTHSGAIMGTPSYMAPEQALGRTKEAGPAADVYSLGAIFYDLLTGRPPFQGTTVLQTLQQVQSLEPVSPVRLQPQVPRDLETICLKALAKDPAKRYESAQAFAEDLRRYREGEPILARPTPAWERALKWAKRRPTAAATLAASILGAILVLTLGGLYLDSQRRAAEDKAAQEKKLADLAQENEKLAQAQAEKEASLRRLAEKNFQRARQAVDQMLSKVGQEKLAHIPQMEKVRRELLEKALEFYKEFRSEKATDPSVRWESARAQERVADILEKLGEHASAEKAYQTALTELQTLVKEQPGQLDFRNDLATVSANLGNLLKDVKRTQEAEKIYREALKVRLDLSEKHPKRPEFLLELARSHVNLGTVLIVIGKYPDAEPSFKSARKILTALTLLAPKNSQYPLELAKCLGNLSNLQKNLAQLGEAEKTQREARDLLTRQAKVYPDNPELQQELALACLHLGQLQRDSQPALAEANIEKALTIRADLAKKFPSTPSYRQELAQAHAELAVVLQAAGKLQAADKAYDQALAIQTQMAEEYPHLPDFRRKLASSWNNRGNMLLTQGRIPEAEKAYLRSEDLFKKLSAQFPAVPDYAGELVGVYLNLGTLWHSAGRPKEAEASYRLALKTRRELAQQHPKSLEHQKDLGSVLVNLATLLQIQGQADEAEKLYREAGLLFAKVSSEHPGEPDLRQQWALTLQNLGNLLRQSDQGKEAEPQWNQAIELLGALVDEFPNTPGYRLDLARCLNELAIYQAGSKQLPSAEASWQRAIDLLMPLITANPSNLEVRVQLSQFQGNLGVLKVQNDRTDKAIEQFRAAIATLEGFDAKGPMPVALARELVKNHQNLARLLESLKRPTESEKSWFRVLELQESLVKHYPNQPEHRLEASQTLQEFAGRMLAQKEYAEAKPYLQKAVVLLGELRPVPPLLQACRLQLADAHLGLKEAESALKQVDAILKETKDASPYPASALLLLRLAKLDTKEAKTHQDRALDLMLKAVAAGFREESFLRTAPELASIREREEFQKMLASLGK